MNLVNENNKNNVSEEIIASLSQLSDDSNFENKSISHQPVCNLHEVPDVKTYLNTLQGYGIGLIVYGAVAVFIISFISLSAIIHVLKHGKHKSRIVFILCSYPVVSFTLLTSMVVPRSHLIAERIGECMFTFCMYQLFCLFISYCGGESEIIRTTKPNTLNLKAAPCCCYPCCLLPVYTANKKNIKFLRLLVLQCPIIYSITNSIFLFIWMDQKDYAVNSTYIGAAVLICSILSAIWGITMTVRMLETRLENHFLSKKFFSFQLIFVFVKLQSLIVKIVLFFDVIPCHPPLTPSIYATIIFNCVVLFQLVPTAIWANRLYTRSEPEVQPLTSRAEVSTVYSSVEKEQQTNTTISTPCSPKINNNLHCYDNQNFVVDIKM